MNALLMEVSASPVTTFLARLTALFALGFIVTTLLRRRSAATRHLAWTLTMVAALLLAPAMLFLPSIDLPVLGREITRERVVLDPQTPPSEKLLSPQTTSVEEKVVSPVPLSAGSVMLLVWLGGALLLVARYAIGHLGLARLASRAVAVRDGEWLTLLGSIAAQMRVRRPIGLAESGEIGAPITWRAARPLILIPAESADWTGERRRVVLLHEVAHISRFDYVTQLAASAACALYWAHPLAWLAARRMRAASEQAADDRVIAAGTLPTDYATHLLNVARSARSLRLSGAVAIGMARKSTLEGRMLALLDDTRDRRATSRAARYAAGAVGLTALIAIAAIRPVPAEAAQARARFIEVPKTTTPAQPATFSRTVDVRGQSELVVDVQLRGKVTIKGWGEPRVRVSGQFSSADPDRPTITTLSEVGRIVVRAERSSRRANAADYSLEILVPGTFDVRLLDAGREAVISDVSGRVRNETGAGTLMVQGRTIHLLPSDKSAEEVPLKLDRSGFYEQEKPKFETTYQEKPKSDGFYYSLSPKFEWSNGDKWAFEKAFENFEYDFKDKFGKAF
jgi:beta-lactamase regulating signal transducer with metallopeptidase domain